MISCATIWITVLCYSLLTLIVQHIQFCWSGSTRFTQSGLTPGLTISGAINLVTLPMHNDDVLSDGSGAGVLDNADLETIPDDNVTCHSWVQQCADVLEDDCEPVMTTWSIVGKTNLCRTQQLARWLALQVIQQSTMQCFLVCVTRCLNFHGK